MKREGAITKKGGACYRGVPTPQDKPQAELEVEEEDTRIVNVPVTQSFARSSYLKCREGSKNTVRIFIPGDIVTILEHPGARPTDSVWVLVEKRKSKALRTWLRPLNEVRERVVETGSAVFQCPVLGRGFVKANPMTKHPDTECLAISIDGKTRIWVEAGLFQEVRCGEVGSAKGTNDSTVSAAITVTAPGSGTDAEKTVDVTGNESRYLRPCQVDVKKEEAGVCELEQCRKICKKRKATSEDGEAEVVCITETVVVSKQQDEKALF